MKCDAGVNEEHCGENEQSGPCQPRKGGFSGRNHYPRNTNPGRNNKEDRRDEPGEYHLLVVKRVVAAEK